MGAGSTQLRVDGRGRAAETAVRPLLHQAPVDRVRPVHLSRNAQDRARPARVVRRLSDDRHCCASESVPRHCSQFRGSGQRVVNAMTVDVEDYFQVSAFEGSCRARAGIRARAACAGTPSGCWISSPARRSKRRFSCSAGSRSGFRGSCGGSSARGTSWPRTATSIGSCTRRRPASSGTISGARVSRSSRREAVRVLGYRAPSYSIVRESLWALDVLIEEGYVLRLEHLPDPARPIWHSRTGLERCTASNV